MTAAERIHEVLTLALRCDDKAHECHVPHQLRDPEGRRDKAENIFHCPTCGDFNTWIEPQPDGQLAIRNPCKGNCEKWTVARALAIHLSSLDQAPLWAEMERRDPPQLSLRTARTFALDTPAAPAYAIDGLVAFGLKTELSAPPKAGKTTLILAAIAAMRAGCPFLGRRTRYAPVIILTEENAVTFKDAMRRAGLLDADDVYVITRREAGGLSLAELIPDVIKFSRRFADPCLLFVDTLPSWAGFEGEEENFSGAALEAIQPLDNAAAAGLAVLYTRHDRKGGGAVGESGRGSSAFAGAADALLALRRAEGTGAPNRRTLSGLGRLDGLPDRMVIEYRDGRFEVVGEGANAVQDAASAAVLAALAGAGAPVTEKELLAAVPGVSRGTVRDALAALVEANRVSVVTGLGPNRRANGYEMK